MAATRCTTLLGDPLDGGGGRHSGEQRAVVGSGCGRGGGVRSLGPILLRRFGAAGAAALAAAAGILRWIVEAETAAIWVLALVQPLHGFTFALMHLVCMRVIANSVPAHLAATAQALYAVGPGLATAGLVWVSGRLYGAYGPRGFLVMAALCVWHCRWRSDFVAGRQHLFETSLSGWLPIVLRDPYRQRCNSFRIEWPGQSSTPFAWRRIRVARSPLSREIPKRSSYLRLASDSPADLRNRTSLARQCACAKGH